MTFLSVAVSSLAFIGKRTTFVILAWLTSVLIVLKIYYESKKAIAILLALVLVDNPEVHRYIAAREVHGRVYATKLGTLTIADTNESNWF